MHIEENFDFQCMLGFRNVHIKLKLMVTWQVGIMVVTRRGMGILVRLKFWDFFKPVFKKIFVGHMVLESRETDFSIDENFISFFVSK